MSDQVTLKENHRGFTFYCLAWVEDRTVRVTKAWHKDPTALLSLGEREAINCYTFEGKMSIPSLNVRKRKYIEVQ